MKGPRKPQAPEKEIRFTRAGQGFLFAAIGVLFFCLAGGWAVLANSYRIWGPAIATTVTSQWPALVLALVGGAFLWGAVFLTRHAYLIFTPLGIELFPFWRPSKNFAVFYWSELEEIELEPEKHLLTLRRKGEDEAHVFISTRPLSGRSRDLLSQTVDGLRKRKDSEHQVA
ncbi:MAG: hypothetical protein AAF514_02650 [Verrucomicrobiota bacterium]